jgi:urea transport system ATP-binding protein
VTTALSCSDITSAYGETEVLHGVGVSIEAGEIYALVGKNGAGKSTFLKTIIGLLHPRSGTIEIFSEEVTSWATHRIIAKRIAYAPQENAFFTDLTCDENLRLGSLSLNERRFRDRRDRVTQIFPFLAQRLRQKAGTLSGGEQAMLKVARALLSEPKIVLFDEVSEGLQPLTLDRLRNALVVEHRDREITILLVEQNMDFVTSFATRYGLLERGYIRGQGFVTEPGATDRIHQHLTI